MKTLDSPPVPPGEGGGRQLFLVTFQDSREQLLVLVLSISSFLRTFKNRQGKSKKKSQN